MLAECTLRFFPSKKPLAARAREADDARRVADDDGVRRHVAHDDRPSPDHRARADAHRSDEHRRGADGRAIADVRPIPIGRARVLGAGALHVGEGRGGTDEDVLAELDAVPQGRVALNASPRADARAIGDETKRADDDVRAEDGAFAHDARLVNFRRRAFA
jgi:hypothetical protein